jgi:delta(3,5)-delta(2,4)-dienoyl-CoA isomerase
MFLQRCYFNNFFRTIPSISRFFSSEVKQLPTFESLKLETRGNHVFNVQLNLPETRNAITMESWKELKECFDYLDQESKCRVVVLTANGQSFCAGLNLKTGLTKMIETSKDESLDVARRAFIFRKFLQVAQDAYTAIDKCQKPVIAAIHGHCIGGGTSLITSTDIRYTVSDAIFSIKEVDIGIAADIGILQRIQNLVGNDSLSRELIYTARIFSGTQAKEYGNLTHSHNTHILISRKFFRTCFKNFSNS